MGNAGEARLDVVALGRDEMSAAVNKVNAELDAMKAKLRSFEAANASSAATTKATTATVGGLGGKLEGLKESVKPIDKVRGTVENLRSNLLMVVGAATAIGGALVELITSLQEAGTAMKDLKDRAKEFAEGRGAMTDGIDMMRQKLGETKDKTSELYNAAVVGASAARLEVDTLDRAYGEQQKRIADNLVMIQRTKQAYGDSAAAVALELNYRKDIDAAQNVAIKLLNDRKRVAGEIADFERLNLEYLQGQNIEILKMAATQVMPAAGLFFSDKFGAARDLSGKTPAGAPTPPRPPSGGGRRTDAPDMAKRLYEHQRNALDELDAVNVGDTGASEAKGPGRSRGMLGGIGAIGQQIKEIDANRKAVADLVSEYNALAGAIDGLAGPLSGLSAGLGTVASALSQSLGIAAQFAAGDYLGGIAGILGGVMSLFSDTHKKARGIINQADRELSAARSSGPSTIIINVGPGSDPQSVAKAVRQNAYSTRGTGADSRSPGV